MQLRKAVRSQVKLRIGLSSPSGGGKTYSALILAHGMSQDWNKIVLIDTENGSGELYSSLGEYNVLTLEAPYTPERYIEAIETCEKAGMEIIIIDSISHEWEGKGGCLELNDQIANSKFKGNTWSAWSVTGSRHQKFLEKITTSTCHVITTVRNKTETAQVDGRIKKVGTKELTRDGFEYELTVNFNIERDSHTVTAAKDRTGLYIDRDPFLITEETGKELIQWNKSGVIPKTVEELKQEEIDKQSNNFSTYFELFISVKNLDQLNEIKGEMRHKVTIDSKFINKTQMNELVELMKSIEDSIKEKQSKSSDKSPENEKKEGKMIDNEVKKKTSVKSKENKEISNKNLVN